jgi:toxin HigB-1
MIRTFRDRATERLWVGRIARQFSGIEKPARRKLDMLHQALDLGDLRDQHSIRINDQWRICFVWTKEGSENVEIVDYH